jgi:type IV pilus assembly protein PilA
MAAEPNMTANSGFTLIEVLIVVMIIGILTALAIPQYYKTLEKDKSSEAVNLFYTFKSAQDRYNAKYGAFCHNTIANCGFDVPPALHYFNAPPAFTAGGAGNQSWALALTRTNAPEPYGNYTVTYDIEPNAAPALTCSQSDCTNDLLPLKN